MTQQLTLLSFEEKKQNHYVADSYTGIYAMHKYWSKKPYNIIRDFILRYSKEDDIVLDPFCGSGISISESIFSHRKAIGIDINPSAIFITKQMVNKASSSWVQTEFKKIEEDVRKEIDSFYEVKRNDSIFVGTHFLWENGKLSEVWYNTKNPSKKVIDIAHENDLQKSMSFSYENIPFRYPKNNFFHNSRINAKRENHIYDLFTPRNLMALSFLLDRINKVENPEVKELLKFCFTSAVGQASKMVFVIKRRGKFDGTVREAKENNEVGSWVIGYWVPKQHFEINVWNCFENKYKKILKAKKEQEIVNYSLNEAKNFDELKNSKNLLLINQPCQISMKNFPNNSIDYIITDPPHGNRQPYLELSMMWNSWLDKDVNYADEIVISESKDRNKDIKNYNELLFASFCEIERVLKPDHYFSLMFNSLDDETWINLIENMNKLNFNLEKIETLAYSANSVVQDTRKAGLKTDFVLTFQKNLSKRKKNVEMLSLSSNDSYLIELIENFIKKQNGPKVETYQILNYLVYTLLQENKFFRLSEIVPFLKNYEQREKNQIDGCSQK